MTKQELSPIETINYLLIAVLNWEKQDEADKVDLRALIYYTFVCDTILVTRFDTMTAHDILLRSTDRIAFAVAYDKLKQAADYKITQLTIKKLVSN